MKQKRKQINLALLICTFVMLLLAASPTATFAAGNISKPVLTAQANPNPTPLSNVVYSTQEGLFAYNIATAKTLALAGEEVLGFIVSPDSRRVAFYTVVDGSKVALSLINLQGATASEAKVLDGNVGTYDTTGYASLYSLLNEVTFSSDGNLLVYSRVNPNGPNIEVYNEIVKPTELWLGDAQANTIRRLAPNNKSDFMYSIRFSPDGKRVAFKRSSSLGDGTVAGQSALWSVDTDGANLKLLQDGLELSTLQGTAGTDEPPVGQISEVYWNSPLSISFTVYGSTGSNTWVHNLTTGKAWRLFGSNYNEVISWDLYDRTSHRYTFSNSQGLFTIGTASPQDKPVLVSSSFSEVFSFQDNTISFTNGSGKLLVQSINDDGSLAGTAYSLSAMPQSDVRIYDALQTKDGWLVLWELKSSQETFFAVYSADGKKVLLPPVKWTGGYFERLTDEFFILHKLDGLTLLNLTDSSNPTLSVVYTGN